MEPLGKLPRKAYDDFKNFVLKDKLKPSTALYKIMEKHEIHRLDSSNIFHLIELTYPEIDISRNNFTFKIHDSGYSYTVQELNDKQFDELVEEMRTLPPGL
ncbi:MAG: hypothetical protein QM500_05615 [Methylococcales bacterium]